MSSRSRKGAANRAYWCAPAGTTYGEKHISARGRSPCDNRTGAGRWASSSGRSNEGRKRAASISIPMASAAVPFSLACR